MVLSMSMERPFFPNFSYTGPQYYFTHPLFARNMCDRLFDFHPSANGETEVQ